MYHDHAHNKYHILGHSYLHAIYHRYQHIIHVICYISMLSMLEVYDMNASLLFMVASFTPIYHQTYTTYFMLILRHAILLRDTCQAF